MTKPIAHGARIGGVWYVCLFGRFGTGRTFNEACAVARGAS